MDWAESITAVMDPPLVLAPEPDLGPVFTMDPSPALIFAGSASTLEPALVHGASTTPPWCQLFLTE